MCIKLSPIVKWAGGKDRELKYIIPNIPKHYCNYFEPFVGGGSVFTAIKANEYYINDKSSELINLYNIITSSNRVLFFEILENLEKEWSSLKKLVVDNQEHFIEICNNELIKLNTSITKKLKLMFSEYFDYNVDNLINEVYKNIKRKSNRAEFLSEKMGDKFIKDLLLIIETAVKSAFYTHIRYIYNNKDKFNLNLSQQSVLFLFIRNFCYSGMFRYNLKGEFNVPYGGNSYNNKNFKKKIEYLKSQPLQELLNKTNIFSEDFDDFFKINKPTKDDFVFLDPPYDSVFNTYSQNDFTRNDQKRLASYLINNCQAKWLMIVKNTDFILDLYTNDNIKISTFDKTYQVNFMNRNNKEVTHLLITNYEK